MPLHTRFKGDFNSLSMTSWILKLSGIDGLVVGIFDGFEGNDGIYFSICLSSFAF